MTYDLYAERDCCERRLMCRNASLAALAQYVEEADVAGIWPLGFEAIARHSQDRDRIYLFTDNWTRLGS